MFVGGDCPSPATALSISASSRFKDSLSLVDIFWYAVLTSRFFCASYHPYAMSPISMGASLRTMRASLLASVYRAGLPKL